MTQYGFAFFGNRCSGCKTCTLACMDYYDLNHIRFRTVYEYGGGTTKLDEDNRLKSDAYVYYVSVACNHCDFPACVHVCPTGAMSKDADNGLVTVDASRCIGCGYCTMACPYGNPEVSKESGHSEKCSGCMDRVKDGKRPICVEACPLRALDFGPIADLREKYGDNASLAPLPDPNYTKPNLVVVNPAHASSSEASSGSVTNVNEVK